MPHTSWAQGMDTASLYTKCAFYPQANVCEEVYKVALSDRDNPAAEAVRAEYEGYGRYLKSNGTQLTAEDLDYLGSNGIRLPESLSPAKQAGYIT